MEMEDHHHHHHHGQYGSAMADLRQLMNGRNHHPHLSIPSNIPPTAAAAADHHLFSSAPPQPLQPPSFEMMMMVRPVSAAEIMPRGLPHLHHHHHDYFRSDNSAGNSTASIPAVTNSAPSTLSGGGGGGGGGLDAETVGGGGGDGGTGRWPRQETLTLLEIRSRLDSKFKEANQKGPLWDEVSRIMSEEHGYQRSGKKCREKFENLYKYYKKTKEGKAGRQDGKHYRFFRQLEALYGESSNQISVPDQTQYMSNNLRFVTNTGSNPISTTHHDHHIHQLGYNNQSHNSLSLSNSSEFESSSSDDNDSSEKRRNRRGGSRGWKAKIKDFIDSQMRKLMEKQEAWLEKLMKTLEQKEKERSLREEEWRKQEVARIEKEHKFWAKERAWIEARDSALMEALKNLTGKEIDHYKSNLACSSLPDQILNNNNQDIDQDHGSEVQNNVSRAKLGDHHDDRNSWPESEITRMIQLRTSMESRFSQGGFPEEVLWEDIAEKMACLGYDRSGSMCKEKWESINDYVKKSKEVSTSSSGKKRKENSTVGCGGYSNFLNNDNINNNDNNNNNENSSSLYNHGGYNCDQMNDHGNATTTSSPASNANVGSGTGGGGGVHHESCFPAFLIGEGTENLWENYGMKINKGGQNQ